MALLERTYTIPLRKEFLKAPKYKRAKKAASAVREFLQKHMKSEDVRIGQHLNDTIWERGIRRPPSRIKVTVQKDEKGVVRAELHGKPIVAPEVKTAKKGVLGKVAEAITKPAEKAKKPEAAPTKPGASQKPAAGTPKTPEPGIHPATSETPTPLHTHPHTHTGTPTVRPSMQPAVKPVMQPVKKEDVKAELKQGETSIDAGLKALEGKTAEMKKAVKR